MQGQDFYLLFDDDRTVVDTGFVHPATVDRDWSAIAQHLQHRALPADTPRLEPSQTDDHGTNCERSEG